LFKKPSELTVQECVVITYIMSHIIGTYAGRDSIVCP